MRRLAILRMGDMLLAVRSKTGRDLCLVNGCDGTVVVDMNRNIVLDITGKSVAEAHTMIKMTFKPLT